MTDEGVCFSLPPKVPGGLQIYTTAFGLSAAVLQVLGSQLTLD